MWRHVWKTTSVPRCLTPTPDDCYDPETGQDAPLFHPRQHTWAEHFTWDATFTLIIGQTATGRAPPPIIPRLLDHQRQIDRPGTGDGPQLLAVNAIIGCEVEGAVGVGQPGRV